MNRSFLAGHFGQARVAKLPSPPRQHEDIASVEDIHSLRERAKELRCLYAIDGVLADRQQTPERAFLRAIEEVPAGWQRPASIGVCIEYLGHRYATPRFTEDGPGMSEPIVLWGVDVGRIVICDRDAAAAAETPPFLDEEVELLRRIAGRIDEFLEWKHSEMLGSQTPRTRNHWAWRQRFAEALADCLDAERFGVSRIFLGGSTARGEAGPGSDIDLYIDCYGSEEQRSHLILWIEGWSLCLGQVALQQTGQPFPGGILNVQWLNGKPDVWQQAELLELKLSE